MNREQITRSINALRQAHDTIQIYGAALDHKDYIFITSALRQTEDKLTEARWQLDQTS